MTTLAASTTRLRQKIQRASAGAARSGSSSSSSTATAKPSGGTGRRQLRQQQQQHSLAQQNSSSSSTTALPSPPRSQLSSVVVHRRLASALAAGTVGGDGDGRLPLLLFLRHHQRHRDGPAAGLLALRSWGGSRHQSLSSLPASVVVPPAASPPALAPFSSRRFWEAIVAAVVVAVAAVAASSAALPSHWCLLGAAVSNGGDGEVDDNEEEVDRMGTLVGRSNLNNVKSRRRRRSLYFATTARRTRTTECEGGIPGSTTTTSSSPSPAGTTAPNSSVSFRPRWLDHLFSAGQHLPQQPHVSGAGPSTSGSIAENAVASACIATRRRDEVMLQSPGKPYDVSVRAIRGGRYTMEDEYYVANGGRFAAVFDGHGGVGVAQYLKKQLYPYVTHHLLLKHWEESDDVDVDYDQAQDDASAGESGNDDEAERDSSQAPGRSSGLDSGTAPGPTAHFRRRASGRGGPEGAVQVHQRPSLSSHVGALRAAFEQVEREVIEDDNLEFQGSTAVAVVVYESEDGHRTLLSANVGDSRAVLSRGGRAVDLTHDHKPNDEKEKARIMALGETIEWDQDCKVHRVRNLSLARAIGDRYAKPAVSPEVDIQLFPVVESEDEFVLLASDGLWDVMSSQDAVTFVHDYMRKELASSSRMSREAEDSHRLVLRRNMAKFLAREAIRKGSSDNVSVLMVWL